jgi:hypothetical protein
VISSSVLEFTVNLPNSLEGRARHKYDIPIEGVDFDRPIAGENDGDT